MATRALEWLVDDAATADIDESTLSDRYRGVLLGVAAGNALCIPVEGESHSSIRRHYPDGLREVAREEIERPWDDDLALTVVIAEALLRTQELNLDYLAPKIVQWARDNGRGIGQLTELVVSELASGTPAGDAARRAWERSGWSTAGNGAVMRCAPVAMRWRKEGAALVRNARTSALITHYDARCEWSTVSFDVALAVALSGGVVELDALAAALDKIGRQTWADEGVRQVAEAVAELSGKGLRDLALDDPMDMGYTLKAMQVGLWALQQADDFETIVAEVVAAGGDTDTNGAIAGAAMGARMGASSIPERWLAHMAGTDRLVELADALREASQKTIA